MDPETLNFWANAAAIFLFFNALVMTILTGVAFGFAWWYLRKGRIWLGMPLLMAQVYALRAQHITTQVADRIVNVPITIRAVSAQVTTTTRLVSASVVQSFQGDKRTAPPTLTAGATAITPTAALPAPPDSTESP